ncbi:hypothetical protein EVG20_g2717 [Dentipellis fragilis]|uniref:Uncharacterized protein n=1 Tax=Dentipellis fragilis TaxID=205917 RepID=A0A4Y9Z826_9AGAM|nr:hypothetical protein EVG20_g2717 [Dentipellis fragilis]
MGVHIPVTQLFPSTSKLGPERPSQDTDTTVSAKSRPEHSSSNEHRYAGPSRINWICNMAPGTPSPVSPVELPRRPPFAHILGRSVSSPSPLSERASTYPYTHPTIQSNPSLQLDTVARRQAAEIEDNLTLLHIKPLSPIMERSRGGRWISPIEGSPSSPGTPASYDIGLLELAPHHGHGVPAPRTNTAPAWTSRPPFAMAHRAGPQLFSTVYEDAASERTGSFHTAPSVQDDADTEEDITHASQTHADPHLLVSAPTLADARLTNPSFTHELTHSPEPFLTDPNAPPVRPRRASPSPPSEAPSRSRASDFIMERWRRSLSSYGSTRPSFTMLLAASAWRIRPHLPKVLFWAGFVAPWCWLIGGWLIAEARFPTARHKGAVLPRWRTRASTSTGPGTEKGKAGGGAKDEPKDTGQTLGRPRPRWCTRWDSIAGAVAAETQGQPADKEVIVAIETRATRMKNVTWVVRCRVAAVVSGLLLAIAFIVALVLMGRGR